MINLATLTGAILIALGQSRAGLFSNDDELAGQLYEAGEASGDRVWRMPMGEEYDKMIDSKFADMKNVGGRHAGRSPPPSSSSASSATCRGAISTSPAPPGVACQRHQPVLGFGLRRAPARPAGRRPLREPDRKGDGRDLLLSPDRIDPRRSAADA
jgi:hypothetical protein